MGASHSSTVIYFSHLAIRLLCLVFKIYLDNYYHDKLRLYGYYKHHSKSTFLSELTHLLFNKITLLLLFNSSIYQVISTNTDDNLHIFGFTITQTQIAKIITVVLSCIITVISGKKLHVEIDFQRKSIAPDSIVEAQINDPNERPNDVGIRPSNQTEDLLRYQNDMIINLQSQNLHLRQLLMKSRESNNPPTNATA